MLRRFAQWCSPLSRCQELMRDAPPDVDIRLCAPTGSGKTLAYLSLLRGRNIVLVPTRELAMQVAQVAAPLFPKVDLLVGKKCLPIRIGELVCSTQLHLLVSTPGGLLSWLSTSKELFPFNTIVIDEFDRLVDSGFFIQLNKILTLVSYTTLFAVSATFPPEALILSQRLLRPGFCSINVPGSPPLPLLHKLVVYEPLQFCSTLLSLLEQTSGPTLVLFPTTHTLIFFHHMLKMKLQRILCLHGKMDNRFQIFELFQSSDFHILLSTDLAARGLDFPKLERVIQIGFPGGEDPVAQFIHRGGRVGRLGGRVGAENVLMVGKGLDSRSKLVSRVKSQVDFVDSVNFVPSMIAFPNIDKRASLLASKCLHSLLPWFIERQKDLGLVGESKAQIVKSLIDIVRSTGVVQPRISSKLATKLRIDHLAGIFK